MQAFSPVDIKLIVKLQDAKARLDAMKAERMPRVAILAQHGLCQFYRSEIRKEMSGRFPVTEVCLDPLRDAPSATVAHHGTD